VSHYKLIALEPALCDEFVRLISLESSPSANWNNNRYGYISYLLLESFNQAEDKIEFVKQALKFPSSNSSSITVRQRRVLTVPLLGKEYRGGEPAAATLRTIISLIELHLSSLKVVQFESSYQQNFSLSKGGLETSALFLVLPDLMRCLLVAITPVTIEQYISSIPATWVESYNEHIASLSTYKTQTAAIGAYRRLTFTMGLSKFSSLTDEVVKEFRLIDDNGSNRSYGYAVAFLRDLGAIELTTKGVAATRSLSTAKINEHRQRMGKRFAVNAVEANPDESDSLSYRLSNDGFYHLVGKAANRCCGLNGVHVSIKRKAKDNSFSFGDYEFNDDWVSYSIDSLKETNSPWIKSQAEYIKSRHEKGTKKQVGDSFQRLNAYLFNYLPYFFENNNVPYRFPDKISDFRNAIYVSPSDIITEHLYKSSDIKFPLSIIDWFKISHKDLKDSVTKARISNVSGYFDFVKVKYLGIDDYELEENPLSSMDLKRIRGQGYKRSNKKLLQLEYWTLFTEFLQVVTDRLINDIEEEASTPKVSEISVKVNRDIEFGDIKIHIGNLKDVDLKKCVIGAKSYPRPQVMLALLIMARSDLRMANVMNLDVRTYDQNYDHFMEYKDSDFVELHVNTDKAKNSSFTSLLSFPTFKLLKRFVALRGSIHGVPTSPIPYNGSEDSKWGEVLPILAATKTNNWDASILPSLLDAFEMEARKAGVNLGTETYYKPIFQTPKTFNTLLASQQRTASEQYCIHYQTGGSAFFTPIEKGSDVTPHSFRKTLDTYYSLKIGDKLTGKFFTGQTEGMVGYYREVTPEVFNQVMAHTENISLPDVIPVKEISKDEDEIRRQLAEKGLTGVKGFTMSAVDSDINIQLSATNPSDIAINHTHICIYENNCPPEILDSLQGKKNCAVCPVSIGTPHDGIAIAAQIKYHVDNISDINELLKDESLINAEKTSLMLARADELTLACSWFVRHKFLVSEAEKHSNYYVLEDGGEKVRKKLKYMMSSSESEEIHSRLMETKSAPSLQSNKLKQTAARLSRKLVRIIENGDIDIPDVKPVEVALSLIGKVAAAHGIPESKLNELIKESGNNPNLSLDNLLQIGGPDEG
jgi:hypothetical protein